MKKKTTWSVIGSILSQGLSILGVEPEISGAISEMLLALAVLFLRSGMIENESKMLDVRRNLSA